MSGTLTETNRTKGPPSSRRRPDQGPGDRGAGTWLGRRLRRLSPWVRDIPLVVIDAVAVSISISAAREPVGQDPDAFAYGLGLAMALLLFGRRRWPIGVLLGTTAIFQLYNQLNYPGFIPAIPFAIPLYSAAAARHLVLPIIISTVHAGGPLIYRLLVTSEPVTRIVNDAVRDVAFFASIILLGAVVEGRRAHAAEVAERLRRAESERERVAQELRVARLVQQQFLPDHLPELPGWKVAAFYRSAREVGGDFYSFIDLPGERLGIAIGDVTDKGAPAALVMATTQALLRAEGPNLVTPSAVLEKINEVLVSNTPEMMFVTCLYMLLDPKTGHVTFANAGHNLPYVATENGVLELKATGMPLGVMADTTYELKEAEVGQGTRVLLHSDGVAEAHSQERDMFGFPRIVKVMEDRSSGDDLIGDLLGELDRFTGPTWEQEDDITLVTLERLP